MVPRYDFAGQFRNWHRMPESVRTQNEDFGQLRGIFRVGAQVIVHHQVAARAVVLGFGFAAFGVRQQIAKGVGPKLVEALPRHPIGRPAALRVGSEHDGASQPVLPAHQQRILLVNLQNRVGGRAC